MIKALLDRLRALQAPAMSMDKPAADFRIPVLCYHSWTINGPDYESNDHVALEQDLKILGSRAYQVLPVPDLLAALHGEIPVENLAGKKLVCLTCDDGRDFDYYECKSSQWSPVPSFHDILERSRAWLGQYSSGPRAVSFVIASPEARAILDQSSGTGLGEWQDEWWEKSAAAGILGIGNHSWDHVHDSLPEVRQKENRKGSFLEITTFEDAERQIAAAQDYINQKTCNKIEPAFGYPYGHVPPYLRDEYFPQHGARLGLRGAFSTEGAFVTRATNLWDIPRFVCGWHWKGPQAFAKLLDEAESGAYESLA